MQSIEYDTTGLTQNGKLAQLIEERKIYGLPLTYGQRPVHEPVEVILPDGPLIEVRTCRITLTRRGVQWATIEYFDTLWDALTWVASKHTKHYSPDYCIVGQGKCYSRLKKLEVYQASW